MPFVPTSSPDAQLAILNVKDFGAQGTGSSNDTVAIQAALNAASASGGAVVWVPPGNYGIVSALSIGSNTTLDLSAGATITLLAGHNVQMLANAGASNNDITVRGGTWNMNVAIPQDALAFTAVTRLTVRDTRIIKSSASPSNACIHTVNCVDSRIDANTVENGQYGILNEATTTSSRVVITRNRVTNPSSNGIFLGNNSGTSTGHVVTDNIVDTTGFIGIAGGTGNSGIVIAGNSVTNTANHGIDIGNSKDVVVAHNRIGGCLAGFSCDYLSEATNAWANIIYIGNVVTNPTDPAGGCKLAGTTAGVTNGISFVNNTIRDCFGDGMQFLRVGQGNISGNQVFNMAAGSAGIRLSIACSRLLISNNEFRGPAGSISIAFDTGVNAYNGFANTFLNNQMQGTQFTFNGTPNAQDIFRGNIGFDPFGHGVSQPGVPLTTVPLTNTTNHDCYVAITAGAGSTTAVTLGATVASTIPASGIGGYMVPAGSSITLAYTSAPTWQWFGV